MKRVISLHTSPWYSCHGWLGREITKFLVYLTQMSCCLSHLHWLWFFVSLAFWDDSLLTMYCIPFQFYFLSIYVNDALFFSFFFYSKRALWRNVLSSCIQYFLCLAVDSIFHVFVVFQVWRKGGILSVCFCSFFSFFFSFWEAWTFVSVNLIPSEHKHMHKI